MNEATIDRWGEASKVTQKLIGSWSFNRVIKGLATMQGIATFTPLMGDRLAYREQGHLKLANGTIVQAEREYVFSSSDGGFSVFFKENPPRLFHEISLSASSGGELSGHASHLCGRDEYRSAYRFLPDGTFVVRHVVSGPAKDYTMNTTYTPLA
ncbi:hypothetical protein A5906_28860 [Bradyrhizobium sacchari]|uniref:DUF6314 domain-containing protein n=1 Tax=Bradyrhizobium sacchari TaxID=1399419 RepID=A0A560JZV4_9BRAD|nr:DUF6314 family protein [Bradyrhizobium sacchari]OPY99680.1 hypothetical protein A5906_28860 [Bradyrhizobium sacchari]TWB62438.1 hypothetical protein FBZ94_103125 [Bradyrhizobium sacchari]TWB76633.1 hypothetical protein FBZ95_104826 [Bradyrhizobium sacchari]